MRRRSSGSIRRRASTRCARSNWRKTWRAIMATPTGIGVAQALVRLCARTHNLAPGAGAAPGALALAPVDDRAPGRPDPGYGCVAGAAAPQTHGRQRLVDARPRKPYWPGYLAATGALRPGGAAGRGAARRCWSDQHRHAVSCCRWWAWRCSLDAGRPRWRAAGRGHVRLFFVPPRMSFNVSDVQYLSSPLP